MLAGPANTVFKSADMALRAAQAKRKLLLIQRTNIAQSEENVKILSTHLAESRMEQNTFIHELLLIYGHRKESVTRLPLVKVSITVRILIFRPS